MLTSLLFASLATVASAIYPIQVNGTKFFNSNTGEQFFIKGVAYQPSDVNSTSTSTISDPLADSTGCTNAVSLLTELGVNVIRTYEVDPTQNHDACMTTFANAGIYLFLDLETPDTTVSSDDPTWTVTQYEAFTATVDAFAQYENTAGFFIGNENVNQYNRSIAAPFVKAAARDIRSYIAAKGYRAIPVGYAGADVVGLQTQLANYLTCGNATDGVDFIALNVYSWCGESSYTASGYDVLYADYQSLTRPAFFSEFGCNIPLGETRTFGDIPTLYGNMSNVFSGGIVYEWVQEANSYGLVTSASSGASPTPLADYSVLKTQWAAVSPSSTALSAYAGSTASVSCSPTASGFVAATSLPPSPNSAYCSCAAAAAKCSAKPASASGTAVASAFGYVCGALSGAACSVITANGTSPGQYGQYSFCDADDQLALVYQQYFSIESSATSACGFPYATLVASPASATCKNSGIAAAVAAASTASTSTGTGSSSSSTSSSTKSFAQRSADSTQTYLLMFASSVVLGGVALIVM